jgi:hypothetical protein
MLVLIALFHCFCFGVMLIWLEVVVVVETGSGTTGEVVVVVVVILVIALVSFIALEFGCFGYVMCRRLHLSIILW